jgi:tetratricopeptide (TPR) repeat protein
MIRWICALAMLIAMAAAATAADDYKALYRKGVELNKKGDFKGAIALYTKALEQKKDSADLYFVRGRAYTQDEQYEKGLADLTKAVTLKPEYAEAYNHRGAIYVGLGKKDLAIADFKKSCELKNVGGCENLKKLKDAKK